MNIEQERKDFEREMNAIRFFPAEIDFSRTTSPSGRDEYVNTHLQSCWLGWQARAALQEQGREDALRYRFLKARQDIDDEDLEFAVVVNAHFDLFQSSQELEEAIDHARRKGEQTS